MPEPTFSVQDFLANVGERLVLEFAHAAQGSTPTLAGDSREHPARRQLERLLPPAAGVGSGVVIDCTGRASKQQDVVIYDRSVTPVFSVNENPSATYYPVEGVIAVGEIKTTVGRSELVDAFAKVKSVQDLRRCVGPVPERFRPYGMSGTLHGTPLEAFDQDANATDQVFGFVLCQALSASIQTTVDNVTELWRHKDAAPGPGAIVALEAGIIQPIRDSGRVISVNDADSIYFDADHKSGFPRLVEVLSWVVRNGRSTSVDAFGHYLTASASTGQAESRTVPLHIE